MDSGGAAALEVAVQGEERDSRGSASVSSKMRDRGLSFDARVPLRYKKNTYTTLGKMALFKGYYTYQIYLHVYDKLLTFWV